MAEAPTTPTPEAATPPVTPPAGDSPAARLYGEGEAPAAETPAEPAPEAEAPTPEPEAAGEDSQAAPAFDLKLPEGAEAAPAVLAEFTTFATEAGLTPERAQQLVDMHFKQLQAQASAGVAAWDTMVAGWKAEIAADPELGGSKTKEVQTVIGRALDEYGTPEAREAFDSTGLGDNPAVVRFVLKMARALNEGTIVPGVRPIGRKGTTPAERLYGSTT